MKSKIKLIIIILAVIVVLVGAVLVLKLTAPDESIDETETTETVETTTALIYDKNPADIKMLTINNTNSSYKIERVGEGDDAEWTIAEFADAPLNDSMVSAIVESAATLTSQQVASEDAEDLSIYGLDKPQVEYKVEFSDSANTVKEICIGNPTPKTTEIYMCFKGEKKVYTVTSSAVAGLLVDKSQCINKIVYTQYVSSDETDTTDYTKINKLIIDRKDIDYDIVIEYDKRLDNPDAIISNSSTYRLTSPVTMDLNPDNSVAATTGVFGLTATSYEVLNPTERDLADYGITDPYADITMDIAGGDFHITVGNEYLNEEGKQVGYYAYVEGIDVIYIFNNELLPWVTVMPLDITTTLITGNYIYGVSKMDITGTEVEAHFTMTGSTADDYAVKYEDAEADMDLFKDLYQFILRAPAEQLYFEDPTDESTLTISITTALGADVIEFYPIENRRTVIRLNGVTSFSCKTAYLDRLVENINKFKNGEELIENW